MLEKLAEKIVNICPSIGYRATVDSSAISEKRWAMEAGVGCMGKNGLIHNQHGSFFVIGVPASIGVLIRNAPILLLFCMIVVLMNMAFCFVGGRLLKFNLEDIILASNANIGGPTTAAGMAISQGWVKLIGPCMLVGTFGYVIGTWLGILVGSLLGA